MYWGAFPWCSLIHLKFFFSKGKMTEKKADPELHAIVIVTHKEKNNLPSASCVNVRGNTKL